MAHHELDRSATCSRWDNSHPPVLTVESGDTVRMALRDSSDGQVRPDMTLEEFRRIDTLRIHALTGPVAVAGAQPGDTLEVEILSYEHEGWAWTSLQPGLGLLAEDFAATGHYLHLWKLEGDATRSMPGVTLELHPFCGILGVQRAEAGEFRTRAPGPFGGNLDVRHLTAGTRLFLPVLVPDALFSAGDAHAAQGDGEVCINGLEAPMTVTVRLILHRGGKPLSGPFAEYPPIGLLPRRYAGAPWHLFAESDTDPRVAAQRVVRRAIAYLVDRLGLTREQAYILCSAVLDLKISQLVNVPTTTVTGYLPEGMFDVPDTRVRWA